MKSCQDIDAIMTAYVDGESDSRETAAVDAHLAVCPPCRDRAMEEHAVRELVQAKASRLGERAPASLKARCVAASPGREVESNPGWYRRATGWVPLSMAASALLAIGAVFFLGQTQQLEAAFAAQLAIDHDRCFTAVDPAAADFDTQRAESVLARDFGLDVTVPAESDDFDVVDVRECLYDEGHMAHLLCSWRGQPVSLFVVPDRSDRERKLEIVDRDAVIWSRDQNTYVLVTETGPDDLEPLIDYVRRYTD